VAKDYTMASSQSFDENVVEDDEEDAIDEGANYVSATKASLVIQGDSS
jgi:hypothetical protein